MPGNDELGWRITYPRSDGRPDSSSVNQVSFVSRIPSTSAIAVRCIDRNTRNSPISPRARASHLCKAKPLLDFSTKTERLVNLLSTPGARNSLHFRREFSIRSIPRFAAYKRCEHPPSGILSYLTRYLSIGYERVNANP